MHAAAQEKGLIPNTSQRSENQHIQFGNWKHTVEAHLNSIQYIYIYSIKCNSYVFLKKLTKFFQNKSWGLEVFIVQQSGLTDSAVLVPRGGTSWQSHSPHDWEMLFG